MPSVSDFIFPPRPVGKIIPGRLKQYQKKPWIAQPKYNGTRNLIHVMPDGEMVAWGRKAEAHKQWEMTDDVKEQVRSLNLEPDTEYWFDSELMHRKTSDSQYKNRVVFFDVLFAGRYLFKRPNLQGRYDMLAKICGNPTEKESKGGIALVVTPNLWLAPIVQPEDFQDFYDNYTHLDEIEGLVLKKATSSLDNLGRKYYEVPWQIRCRKEHKNYAF